jgi:hypothetical protein
MRGGEHRSRSRPDKPYFEFSAFFFTLPPNPADFHPVPRLQLVSAANLNRHCRSQ